MAILIGIVTALALLCIYAVLTVGPVPESKKRKNSGYTMGGNLNESRVK